MRYAKQKTCKTDVTIVISVQFDCKFLSLPTWSSCGIYVMKKCRVSTTNVPICAKIRSGDKKTFNYIGQVLQSTRDQIFNMAEIRRGWEYGDLVHLAKPVRIAQSESRPQ